MAMNIRLLKENEIEVRVGTINEKGATLLLYKDARVDMNILDESGLKWKRSHELINNNLFCTISVWDDEINDWISRQDVGVESNTEKEKGQASDAFKRAGFNFGIGRELYTAPFIWISADKYNGFVSGKTPQGKDKYSTYDKFSVTKIGYNENKEINKLVIKNLKSSKVVFTLGEKQEEPKADPQKVSQDLIDKISELAVELELDMEKTSQRIQGLQNDAEAKQAIETLEAMRPKPSDNDKEPF